MSTKYLAALAVALSLGACAWTERTEQTIVTRDIQPGPGSSTVPQRIVTDTITKTTGPAGHEPTSVATTQTTTTITPQGSTSSTTMSELKGSIITPSSVPQPIIQPEGMR